MTDWLSSQGFEVSRVAAGRTVIEFSGTAGQVRQAFHTEIHKYAVNDEEHWANSSDPQIPAALAPVVTGFASLNNFPRQPSYRRVGTFTRSKLTGELTPEVTFNVTSGSYYALGPADFATIYGVQPLWNAGTDGTGQTIAIVGETNIKVQDARSFRSMFGLPANDPQIIVDGPDPGVLPDEEVEGNLDVQWAGAVAKGATIKLVVSESTEASAGVDLSALYIVDNNLAPVMSESYGLCEAFLGVSGNTFENAVRQQAAAQGITVINSAGDHGSARCDPSEQGQQMATHGLAVSGLASTSYEVAVGGTDFDDVGVWSTYWNSTNASTTQSSAKSYVPESTWNDSCARSGLSGCSSLSSNGEDLVGGGGGPSTCAIMTGADPNATCVSGYPKPAWQSGPGVPNDGVRDIPDVSLFASDNFNNSFYIFCETDLNLGNTSSCDLNAPYTNFEGGGGTSFAAPAFAGIMALVNQKYGRQGNANYVLYKLAAQSGASCTADASAVSKSSCLFHDVVKGNNSVVCQNGSPNCSVPSIGFGILVDPNSPTTPAWTTTPGYDRATGLGSVNAANLVNNWTKVSFTPSTTTLSLSTTPASSPVTLTHGQPVNVSITVAPSSGTGTPTGDVSLIAQVSSSQSPPGGMFTLSGGTASGTTDLLPGGTYNVIAHYAGDGTFGASDSPGVEVTVGKENSKSQLFLVTYDPATGNVINANTTTAAYGSAYLLRVNVGNSAGTLCQAYSLATINCPTGTAALTDNGQKLDAGTYALNSQGYTEDFDAFHLTGGTHTLQAQYSGDNSYNSSTGNASIIISPGWTMTEAPFNIATPVGVASPVELLSWVDTNVYDTSGAAIPTGTATFYSDGVQLSGSLTITPIPGTPYLSPELALSFVTSFSTSGNHVVTATYSGDANYAPSTSPPNTIDAQYSPLVTMSASALIVAAGSSVTLTALVDTTNKNLPPTGQILFAGSGIGYVPVTSVTDPTGYSAAQAILSYTPTTSASIYALYLGDLNYSTAYSGYVQVTVFPAGTGPDFMFQNQNPPASVTAGGSASTLFSVIPSPGVNATVALTCSVPSNMAEASCSLSPTSVTLTDQVISTSTLTVSTTGPHTVGSLHKPPNWIGRGRGGVVLACFLLLTIPVLRRRPKLVLAALVIALLAAGSLSCGGGAGGGGGGTTDPGTPTGFYDITVTGTATIGGSTVTHTIPLRFDVQ